LSDILEGERFDEGALEGGVVGQFDDPDLADGVVEFYAGLAVEQEGERAGLGGVADELDASGELARQEPEVDQARGAQMETERAGV
jgi:hypothetical protein